MTIERFGHYSYLVEKTNVMRILDKRKIQYNAYFYDAQLTDGVSVAAASILAKVTRDRLMIEYENEYPGYAFAGNKGYGTKLHYEMLDRYGPCPEHRRTFLKKWEARRT